ncbi:MAG: redoxin domain-containing protein [bacterium]
MKRVMFFVFVISILAAVTACNPSPKEAKGSEVSTGNIYLDKTWMESLDNETLTLKGMEGSVVVIDFWASWCGPCKASIPFYIKMHDTYAESGLKVIGVNVNETKEEIESYVSQSGMNYTMAFFNEDLNSIYRVTGIPAVFIFDKKGNKVANFTGYSSELDAKIENIIKTELSK